MDFDPTAQTLELMILEGRFAVSRLEPQSTIPPWAFSEGALTSITRTSDELSIVSPEASVPDNIKAERGWRALRVVGTQDFALVGVLASLVGPLAKAKISIFAISTFDTDYLLVKDDDLGRAIETLEDSGHSVAMGGPRPPSRS